MKTDERNSILFQRYNLKHNRLWTQFITLCVALITIVSAFIISIFALSMYRIIYPQYATIVLKLIFKEYIVLLIIVILFAVGLTTTLNNLWYNKKLLVTLLNKYS